MNKDQRVLIAKQTLAVIENGHYPFEGATIDIQSSLEKSIQDSFVVSPEQWEKRLKEVEKMPKAEQKTMIEVKNCTTIKAILSEQEGFKLGVLNFASAKNPGGGFLGGAIAQEESLARSSSLYASLTHDMTMYQYNNAQSGYLYSDYMIYSSDVLFWLDDAGNFLEKPIIADVITAPAPNKGAMQQNNRPDEILQLETVFRARIEKVLALAKSQQVQCLILGAWGCGVFRNDPALVARLFKEKIMEKYANCFQKIIFAVLDSSEKQLTIKAFAEQMA